MLTVEQKNTWFDRLDAWVDGRSPIGKSAYFNAMCQWMQSLGSDLKRDPVKPPPEWVKP